MTGSAKIARFIAAVVFSSVMLAEQAHSAAPRDALKYLQFTHTSSIKIIENDKGPTFGDNYRGNWNFDWKPPGIKIPGMGSLLVKLHYNQGLTDNLDKIAGTSRDSRNDYYKVDLSSNGLKHLFISYTFDRTDSFENKQGRNSSSSKITTIGFSPPGFPSLIYNNSLITQTGARGEILTSGSETSKTTYQAFFKRNVGAFGQEYTYKYEVNSSSTGVSDNALTKFSGYRQIKFDKLGTILMSYDFSELDSYKAAGSVKETIANNTYVLSWDSKLEPVPLNYNFSFTSDHSSGPNFNRNSERKLIKLTYRPPMPTGKDLVISFDKQMSEYYELANTSRQTAEETTNLRWRFNTNPRTSGEIRYRQTLNTDIKAQQFTLKKEAVSGRLAYQIPGGQGSLDASLEHSTTASPGDRTDTDFINLQNRFKLGKSAMVSLFYSQRYDGVGLPRRDTSTSGISYKLQDQRTGITLDARWKQRMAIPKEFSKDTTQNVSVHFTYNTHANIRYEFLVNEGNTSDTMSFRPNSRDYQSKNEVVFKVTYAF